MRKGCNLMQAGASKMKPKANGRTGLSCRLSGVCVWAAGACSAVCLVAANGEESEMWVGNSSVSLCLFLHWCLWLAMHRTSSPVSRAGSTDLLPGDPLCALAGCPCRDEEAHLATAARSWLAGVGRLAATSASSRTRFCPSPREP